MPVSGDTPMNQAGCAAVHGTQAVTAAQLPKGNTSHYISTDTKMKKGMRCSQRVSLWGKQPHL